MAETRFLEQEEVRRILEQPNLRSMTGLRNRVILQIMAETGVRPGEVLDLRPRDVIINEKKLIVRKGKGSKTRTVYWHSDDLTLLLEKWKKIRPKSSYLFPIVRSENKGQRINSRDWRKQFDRYVDKALGEETKKESKITSHVLRHSFATHFLRDPEHNIRQLQQILGHASLATTERYLHVADPEIAKVMRGY